MTPYQHGRSDYCNDVAEHDNPYQNGTQDAREWHEGWLDCYSEDAEDYRYEDRDYD